MASASVHKGEVNSKTSVCIRTKQSAGTPASMKFLDHVNNGIYLNKRNVHRITIQCFVFPCSMFFSIDIV